MSSLETFDTLLRMVARAPAPESPRPFEAERFRLARRLGEGTFGVVWAAWDAERREEVALKVLKRLDPRHVERLKSEFRSIADVEHPHLVRLHELGCHDDQWWITMDLVDGVDLRTWLDRRPRGTAAWEARLREAFAQLADAVAAVHGSGHLHRDLKPANVLVGEDGLGLCAGALGEADRGAGDDVDCRPRPRPPRHRGHLVVLDFGLATPYAQSAPARSIAGTPAYMAPEQASGAEVPRSDWYAVGVMLFEALTGEHPWGETSTVQHAQARGDADPPSSRRSGIPADLDDLCESLLRREPERRPSGREVLAALSVDVLPAPRPVTDPGFVGRQAELEKLRGALAATEHGSICVTLRGAAGVGKSALGQRFVDDLDPGVLVLCGRCHERESVPFKALDGIVSHLARHLVALPRASAAALMPRDVHLLCRMFPALAEVEAIRDVPRRRMPELDPPDLRRLSMNALRELLGRLADRAPLVLWVDDLQWGDTDSAWMLGELLAPPGAPRVLLLTSFRDEGPISALARETFVRTGDHEAARRRLDIALQPLLESDAVTLARRLAGPRHAATVAAESGGHPLFLRQLAEGVDGRARGGHTLLEVLWSRVREVTGDGAALLRTLAVAGRPLPLLVACEAAGLGAFSPGAVDVLRSRRLIRTTGPRSHDVAEVYHDRVRESLLANLDADEVRRWHLGLAETLEATPNPDPRALAQHFHAGGDPARAGRFAEVAGHRAMDALAFEHAADAYRLALDCTEAPSLRQPLRRRLAEALASAGRGAEAGRELIAACDGADHRDSVDLRRRAVAQFLASGHLDEGMAVLEPLLGDLGTTFPDSLLDAKWRVMTGTLWRGVAPFSVRPRSGRVADPEAAMTIDAFDSIARGMECVSPLRSCVFFAKAANLAVRTGDSVRIARTLPSLALSAWLAGLPRARAMLDDAEALARDLHDAPALAAVHRFRATALAHIEGRYGEAADELELAVAAARDSGADVAGELQVAQRVQVNCLLRCGRLRHALQIGRQSVREAMDRGDVISRHEWLGLYVAPSLLAEDRPRDALDALRDGKVLDGVAAVEWYWHFALAEIQRYRGDGEAGLAVWRVGWPLLEQVGMLAPRAIFVDAARSRTAAAISAGVAAAEVRRMLASIRRLRLPFAQAAVASLDGVLAAKEGDLVRARRRLEVGAARYREVGMSLDAWSCDLRRGELTPGQAGVGLVDSATAAIGAEGIAEPRRWSRLAVPDVPAVTGG